jgi:hypothetical protein
VIDEEIDNQITYSDAIIHLSRSLSAPIDYLELGVSVGKNFLQVASVLEQSTIVGFDIERINPTLERFFQKTAYSEWETMEGSLKKEKSSLSEYEYRKNRIQYISGDIFDESSWNRLAGRKFNLIFSDAFHDPAALIHEYDMIQKYRLLNEREFIIVWDDLGEEMAESFQKIFVGLRDSYRQHPLDSMIIPLNGWVGSKEPKHQIGIMTYIARRPRN